MATFFNDQARGSRVGLLLGEESTFGTAATAGYVLPLTGTSLALNIESFKSERIRSDRMVDAITPGNFGIDGDITTELQAHGLNTLLKHTLGDKAYTVDAPIAGVNKHVFTGAPNLEPAGIGGAGTGESLSIEIQYTDIAQYFLHTGARVTSFSLEFPTTGPVTATFGVSAVALAEAGTSFDGTPTDVTADTSNANEGTTAFSSFHAAVQIPYNSGSPIAFLKRGRIEVANDIGTDNYVVGQRERANLLEGPRAVSGDLTLLFRDLTYYNKWKNSNAESLSLKFQKTGTGANERSIEIVIHNLIYVGEGGGSPTISGGGPIEFTIPFTGLVSVADSTDITITVIGLDADL